jgi:cell division protein FtsB
MQSLLASGFVQAAPAVSSPHSLWHFGTLALWHFGTLAAFARPMPITKSLRENLVKNWTLLSMPTLFNGSLMGFGEKTARYLPFLMLGTSLIAVPWMALGPLGLPKLRALQSELATIHKDNDALSRDIGHLRVEVKALREDPASVERIARDQLGMIRQSEIVFQFAKSSNR